jgi:transmembrane sensor
METEIFFENDYSEYTVRDFLSDEYFIKWVKSEGKNKNLELHFKAVIKHFPEKSAEIKKAVELIKLLSHQETTFNKERKEKVWQTIQGRTVDTAPLKVISISRILIRKHRTIAAILLVAILIAGAGLVGFRIRSWMISADENVFTTIYSPSGQRTEVTLPDKSKVWLNSKSTIRYSSLFNVKNRDIYLDGEAFFDVAKKSLPFEVKTIAMNIRVLGTAFNVKCYEDENIVEATLVRGSMKIAKINKETGVSEEIILKPNQKVQFMRDNSEMAEIEKLTSEETTVSEAEAIPLQQVRQISFIKSYDTKKSTAWKDGLLIVDGESLGDLSKKLERRYDVKFVFTDEELKKFKYSGTLREYSLEQVLKALKMTSPISYRVDKQVVYIDKNEKTNIDFMNLTNKDTKK